MFLVGILSWWYTKGLIKRLQIVEGRIKSSSDLFSIGLLVRTLFNPFRQISADEGGNSLAEKIQALFDRSLSRIIGFVVRTFTIIAGLIVMSVQIIFGVLVLIFWLIIPILPVIGLVLTVLGWKI